MRRSEGDFVIVGERKEGMREILIGRDKERRRTRGWRTPSGGSAEWGTSGRGRTGRREIREAKVGGAVNWERWRV